MLEIEKLFAGIKKAFADSPEIEQTTKDLIDLRDAFGTTNKDGSIPKSSKVLKAFGSGNKIDNVPDSLNRHSPYDRCRSPRLGDFGLPSNTGRRPRRKRRSA